jgi:hypothetical protein
MPRKPSELSEKSSSKNKPRVRFVFEPDRSSPNGITYAWLVHETYNGKEKAATATRAFWLPFAYQDSGNYSEAELKELAQQSIWRLEEQIQHLREAFGLEAPPTQVMVPEKAVAAVPPGTKIELLDEDKPLLPTGDISLSAQQDLADDFSEVL